MANYFKVFPAAYFGGGYWRAGSTAEGTLSAYLMGSSSVSALLSGDAGGGFADMAATIGGGSVVTATAAGAEVEAPPIRAGRSGRRHGGRRIYRPVVGTDADAAALIAGGSRVSATATAAARAGASAQSASATSARIEATDAAPELDNAFWLMAA